MKTAIRFCLALAAACFVAADAHARSVLEGLEIVESDKGGVEVLSVSPGSPAALSGLQAGDRITAIGKTGVKGLDDYVRLSKQLKSGEGDARIEYYREAVRRDAELTLRSSPLREKWGMPVVPWRSAKPDGEREGADHWLERARGEMREAEKKGAKARPEEHARAILSLFSALDANPESLDTAVLVARQYGKLAEIYYRRGERSKAAWCLRRALRLYSNTIQKAGGLPELVLVKNGLQEMQGSLARMQ